MTRVSVTELVRNFSEILGRVRFRGERFLLLKGGKPVAELVPARTSPSVRLRDLPTLLEELPYLDPSDAEQFARDVETARAELSSQEPWGSSSIPACLSPRSGVASPSLPT